MHASQLFFLYPSVRIIRSQSVQSFSRVQPRNHSTPGLPVHHQLHQLPEFSQTHVPRVGDAIQPSHPLSSPSPSAPSPSQHQGIFQWVNSPAWRGQSIGVSASASVLVILYLLWGDQNVDGDLRYIMVQDLLGRRWILTGMEVKYNPAINVNYHIFWLMPWPLMNRTMRLCVENHGFWLWLCGSWYFFTFYKSQFLG